MQARRLAAIAAWINAHWAARGYRAEVIGGFCNTDRPLEGRGRIPGKGRTGNRLLVFRAGSFLPPPKERKIGDTLNATMGANLYRRPGEELVLDHNAAETYRCNAEVEAWIHRQTQAWERSRRG